MQPLFDKLSVMGMGLMGGSLGLAARERGLAREVCGYARREATRHAALLCGAADTVCETPEEAVRGAQMVVFCVPILATVSLVRTCAAHFADGAVVTDVGSTKQQLVDELRSVFAGRASSFVGSHPMTGSDETGLDAAQSDLYEGSLVIVTPDEGAVPGAPAAVGSVTSLWKALGARVEILGAAQHDEAVARTSHLPHLVAATLVSSVCREGGEAWCRFCGPGFRDTTRIAGGSADVWHDIVKTNKTAVAAELQAFGEQLSHLQDLLRAEDYEGVRAFLESSRRQRLGCRRES